MTGPTINRHRSKQDYGTDPLFIKALSERFGAPHVDLAASAENHKAPAWISEDEDSLQQDWSRLFTVEWLNPFCSCKVKPMLYLLGNENEALPELPEELSTNGTLVYEKERQGKPLSLFMVQGMLQKSCKTAPASTAKRPDRKAKTFTGKTKIPPEPKRAGMEAEKFDDLQSCAKAEAPCSAVEMEHRAVEAVQGGVCEQVRLLRLEEANHARPFHINQPPGLSRNGSLEHGHRLFVVQPEEGKSSSNGLVQRQTTYCPNCGQATIAEIGRPLCFLNPPFDNIGAWACKCSTEALSGSRILFLTPASIGSNWFRDYVWGQAKVIALNGRITFDGQVEPEGWQAKHPGKIWEPEVYPKDLMLSVYNPREGLDRPFEIWDWRA